MKSGSANSPAIECEETHQLKHLVILQNFVGFEDYTGSNAYLFQPAVSILVAAIHDFSLKKKQSFILDGTLSNFEIADKNISRSLKRKRHVQILYIYLNPEKAWEFVQARERKEGRKIPSDQFVEQYFRARKNVNKLKQKYGSSIKVDLLLKDIDGSNRLYKAGIDCIDHHKPERYTKDAINEFI